MLNFFGSQTGETQKKIELLPLPKRLVFYAAIYTFRAVVAFVVCIIGLFILAFVFEEYAKPAILVFEAESILQNYAPAPDEIRITRTVSKKLEQSVVCFTAEYEKALTGQVLGGIYAVDVNNKRVIKISDDANYARVCRDGAP